MCEGVFVEAAARTRVRNCRRCVLNTMQRGERLERREHAGRDRGDAVKLEIAESEAVRSRREEGGAVTRNMLLRKMLLEKSPDGREVIWLEWMYIWAVRADNGARVQKQREF